VSWRAPRAAFAEVAALADALGQPEPVAWALVRRGLADPAAAREFLASDGPLAAPEQLAGIAEAADRLARAVRRGEPIAVHGDYDCDGVSSTAILVRALRGRGARVEPFLPSRFEEGYGVADRTIERLAA
jgi:single-stranded-DNA-specific exonuclease